jgi:hypothetical protein
MKSLEGLGVCVSTDSESQAMMFELSDGEPSEAVARAKVEVSEVMACLEIQW